MVLRKASYFSRLASGSQEKKDAHYQTAESQGWISTDEAAQGAIGNDKATGTKNSSTKSNKNNNKEGENK